MNRLKIVLGVFFSPKNQYGAQVASWPCHATDSEGQKDEG
jgi:hypothetical protein